jgi:hypothetical protein
MNEVTAIKKTRKANTQSKAAQIRKLFAQGKLTPKQIGDKVGAPMPYVYVVRSKMKAEAGGLPAVAETKMPVLGGIQDIRDQPQIAINPTTLAMQAPVPAYEPNRAYRYGSPALAPAHVVIEKPTFFERVKNTVRAWLS